MQNNSKHQTKPKKFSDTAFILIVAIPFFVGFVLCQTWNEVVTKNMKRELLLKHYTQDDIAQRNIEVWHTIYKTTFSDGTILSEDEHRHFRTEQFQKTLPATLFPFFALFALSLFLVRKYNPLKITKADSHKKKKSPFHKNHSQ